MTLRRVTFSILIAFSVMAMASIMSVAGATYAQAASLTGSWSGGGSMKLNSGGRERVRCRVTYSRVSGQTFSMSARCASGAGKLSQSGSLSRVAGNTFQGSVYNAQYGVTASVYVKVRGRRQSVYISSAGGSASLTLRKR